jgi:DNA-binding GntR family transcriptional regulator
MQRPAVMPTAKQSPAPTYEPICLDRSLARLLEQATGAPAFAVRRVTRDQQNRLIECVESVLLGDHYTVVLQLERVGARSV